MTASTPGQPEDPTKLSEEGRRLHAEAVGKRLIMPEPLALLKWAGEHIPALLDAYEASTALRAERDALAEAVQRVEALHSGPFMGACHCGSVWPCATVRALAAVPSPDVEEKKR